jgi:hypothetical protein
MKIECKSSSIGSIPILAKTLGVSPQTLTLIASDPSNFYSVSMLPKKNGGYRVISDPTKELKIIQRRIIRRIFSKCTFPNYLFGSVKDDDNPRDFVRNAQFHHAAKEVVAFDIEDFFPSTHPRFVKKVFKYLLRLPDDVANLLVKLTTLNNGLPQGAPSSPYLANLIFYDNEHKFVRVFASKGFKYSRLVDDITISSASVITHQQRSFIYESIQRMLSEKRLKISKHKYQVTNTETHGKKTVITGLIVEKGKVKLPKEKTKEIGRLVYKLKNEAAQGTTEHDYHKCYATTSGLVALYSRLDSEKSEEYRTVLRSVLPTYTKVKIKKIGWLCRRFIAYGRAHPHRRDEEGFAKKYHKFKHKLNIMKRTERKRAQALEAKMRELKPYRLLASYHE